MGEAGSVVLHVDVRPPPGSAAPLSARGLCFSTVEEEGDWPSDSKAVTAVARF